MGSEPALDNVGQTSSVAICRTYSDAASTNPPSPSPPMGQHKKSRDYIESPGTVGSALDLKLEGSGFDPGEECFVPCERERPGRRPTKRAPRGSRPVDVALKWSRSARARGKRPVPDKARETRPSSAWLDGGLRGQKAYRGNQVEGRRWRVERGEGNKCQFSDVGGRRSQRGQARGRAAPPGHGGGRARPKELGLTERGPKGGPLALPAVGGRGGPHGGGGLVRGRSDKAPERSGARGRTRREGEGSTRGGAQWP